MSERDENKPALSDLPPDLLKALVDFRAENGRSWKRTLLAGWLRAAFPGELQRLRNDFGPEWLTRIKDSEFERLSPPVRDLGAGTRGNESPAILYEANYRGEVGNTRHMTRRETVLIPVIALASMSGARGERREFTSVRDSGEMKFGNYSLAEWDKFKADLAKKGMDEPVTINIDCGKEVCIYEGNHRVQAALQNGWKVIAADIRYFGQAEVTFEGGSFFRQTMTQLERDDTARAAPSRHRM